MKHRIIIAAMMTAAAVLAQFPAPPEDFAARAEALVKSYADDGQFQGTVLVKAKDTVIFQKSFGMANAESNTPFSSRTRFRIGSLTKEFTAAAILQLEEKGKLSLSDSITKYYPEAPAEWAAITVEHLLRHNSGIFNYTALDGFDFRKKRTQEEVIATVHDKPLAFTPGTKFSYSNTGYSLLGLIVERVTKTSWRSYMAENVWKPAGLENTGYDRTERISPERAAGYQGDAQRLGNADFIDMSLPHAAGAIYSTAEDFARWLEALEGGSVISQESLRKMMVPGLAGYGYGVGRGRFLGVDYFAHDGGIHGFTTQFFRFPAERLTVVAFSNLQGAPVGQIASKLVETYANRSVAPATVRRAATWTTSQLESIAGRYAIPDGGTVEISLEDDGLVMTDSRIGNGIFPLYPMNADSLFTRLLPAQLTIVPGGAGAAQLRYRLGNDVLTLDREVPVSAKPAGRMEKLIRKPEQLFRTTY